MICKECADKFYMQVITNNACSICTGHFISPHAPPRKLCKGCAEHNYLCEQCEQHLIKRNENNE